ncbi:hypothetical protein [Methanopyrus sp.]
MRWVPVVAALVADAALVWVDVTRPWLVDRYHGIFSALTILAIALTIFVLGWALSPRGDRDRTPFLGY